MRDTRSLLVNICSDDKSGFAQARIVPANLSRIEALLLVLATDSVA